MIQDTVQYGLLPEATSYYVNVLFSPSTKVFLFKRDQYECGIRPCFCKQAGLSKVTTECQEPLVS